MGRPSKLTPEVARTLIQEIAKGVPIIHACAAARIHQKTYYWWKDQAEKGKTKYVKLFDRIRRAEGRLIREQLGMVMHAARHRKDLDWRAYAWYLEKRFPHEFGSPGGRPAAMPATISADKDGKVTLSGVQIYLPENGRLPTDPSVPPITPDADDSEG